jgi:hypothetical protein
MSAKKTAASAPAEKVALYDKLVASVPGVERKGASLPYTAVNGNMFSVLHADGTLGLRLPTQAREAFLAKYNARLVEAYGIVQKEYVAVPAALLERTAELKPYFQQSHAYAQGLKPKPTGRKARPRRA